MFKFIALFWWVITNPSSVKSAVDRIAAAWQLFADRYLPTNKGK